VSCKEINNSDFINVDFLGSISTYNRLSKMKNKLYSLLSFAFFTAIALDILAFWIFEQNPNLLFVQIFLISCLVLSLVLCVPMLLAADIRKSSEL
jgi:hypothetical protein